jgi:hypothetical protein
MLGCGIMAWGMIGLMVSDTAEKTFGLTPTEADKEQLKQSLPRIRTVEKDSTPPRNTRE